MNNIRKIIADKIAELKDKRVTDYADGFNDGLIEAFKVFLELTDELVNKETPKKPFYEGDGYADGFMVYDVARCPNCDNVFEEYENNGWGEDYCHNCGQRLDWSDSE